MAFYLLHNYMDFIIVFELVDEKNDLFHEVAVDIINRLNLEIEQSKPELVKIIQFNSQ